MLSAPLKHVVFLAGAAVFFAPLAARAVTVQTKVDMSVDPGQTVSETIFVKNEGFETQTFYPSIQKFSQTPDGQKVFSDDPTSIAPWMHLPASVTLGPQEDLEVAFTLAAPLDAPPGGHFAVVWWSTAPPGDGGQVAIVTRAGTLVYVRVSGNIVEDGRIRGIEIQPRLAWGLPVSFSSHFVNEGNVALTPQGEIRVANMFGTAKAVLPVNPYGSIILPGSSGSYTSTWEEGGSFFFGAYRASLHLVYGESQQAADQSQWFVMISPLAAAIVILVVVLVFIAPPAIRRYNRWILERAKK